MFNFSFPYLKHAGMYRLFRNNLSSREKLNLNWLNSMACSARFIKCLIDFLRLKTYKKRDRSSDRYPDPRAQAT